MSGQPDEAKRSKRGSNAQYGADKGVAWGVDCGGTTMAGYFGTGLLFSYLLLFLNFYFINYIRKVVIKKLKRGEAKKAQ